MTGDPVLRIGELSKRSGLSVELLRAWERRYHLLKPARSPGGLRLYSPQDLQRVRVMREHLAAGLAAAEAAALASQAELEEEPYGTRFALTPYVKLREPRPAAGSSGSDSDAKLADRSSDEERIRQRCAECYPPRERKRASRGAGKAGPSHSR